METECFQLNIGKCERKCIFNSMKAIAQLATPMKSEMKACFAGNPVFEYKLKFKTQTLNQTRNYRCGVLLIPVNIL